MTQHRSRIEAVGKLHALLADLYPDGRVDWTAVEERAITHGPRARASRAAGHPKTSHGFRLLTLPDFGTAALLDARTHAGTEHVIPNARGGLQHRRGIARAWRDALAAATDDSSALVGITPMAFRKTVATLIARELGPEAAGQQLGHHDNSVTRAFYIERIQAGPEQARSVLERLVGESS